MCSCLPALAPPISLPVHPSAHSDPFLPLLPCLCCRPRSRRRSGGACPSSRWKVRPRAAVAAIAACRLAWQLGSWRAHPPAACPPALTITAGHFTLYLFAVLCRCAVGEKMRGLLVEMKKAHPGQDEAVKTCWQTLLKICGNVYNSPGGWGRHSWFERDRGERSGAVCLAAHNAACAAGHLPCPCLISPFPPACCPPACLPAVPACRGGQVPACAADQPRHPAARGGLHRRRRLPAAGGVPAGGRGRGG